MTEEHQKEQFSLAYVRAVVAAARVNVSRPEVDDDSVDLILSARIVKDRVQRPMAAIQLKCTSALEGDGTHLKFPLLLKNYNDLRLDEIVPRYLVVVHVPENPSDWIAQSPTELVLRRCEYWLSLKGLPDTTNSTSVTVSIPQSQVFDVPTLRTWFNL